MAALSEGSLLGRPPAPTTVTGYSSPHPVPGMTHGQLHPIPVIAYGSIKSHSEEPAPSGVTFSINTRAGSMPLLTLAPCLMPYIKNDHPLGLGSFSEVDPSSELLSTHHHEALHHAAGVGPSSQLPPLCSATSYCWSWPVLNSQVPTAMQHYSPLPYPGCRVTKHSC